MPASLPAIRGDAALQDVLHRVDPEFRAALSDYLDATVTIRQAQDGDLIGLLRARAEARVMAPLAAPPVEIRRIPGTDGAPDVSVQIINADAREIRPAVLHLHGGGFVAGSAAASVPVLQSQAAAIGCVIVSVEYRLAPETPRAGSLADNYAALAWLHRNAEQLGVDRSRIALQGESAGGGHAVLLAQLARERGEIPICYLALTYPMLDDRTGSVRMPPAHLGAWVWPARFNRIAWRAFLGEEPGGEAVPISAVPARIADLSGFPPTFIAVGDIDMFAEEDIEFGLRLVRAGVPVELLVVSGAFHGFDVFNPSARASEVYRQALRRGLERAFDAGSRDRTLRGDAAAATIVPSTSLHSFDGATE